MDEIGEDRGRIRDMSLDVSVRIGETVCKVRDILALKPGQMIVLDKQAGRACRCGGEGSAYREGRCPCKQ